MRTASIAEWILRRVTSKERAAAMVGDLVELQEKKGLLRFWLSISGVAISLFWRRPIAFVAAFYAWAWVSGWFQMAIHGMNALHRPPQLWMPVFNALGLIGSALWAFSLFSAIRYGLQERSAQLSLAYAGLITAVIYLWWLPAVLVVCIVGALVLATASIIKSKLRKESLIFLASVFIYYASVYPTMFLVSVYQNYLHPGPWSGQDMRAHPLLGWLYFVTIALSLWVATWAWSRMRGWLMRSQSLESSSEML
jgi:hypothetical protein